MVLPLASVAVHVTRLVPTGNWAGALLVTVAVPQLSVAVAWPRRTPVAKQTPGLALTVTSPGQSITGGSASRTVTRCGQVVVLPVESVAIQVTKVVPTGNWAGASLLSVAAPQLSLTFGLPK